MSKGNVAILLSGRGSNFAAIVRASRAGGANFAVRLAVSDRADAAGLKKAARFGIPAHFVDPKRFPDKAAYEARICELLEREAIDLVCLAGYMRILSSYFCREFKSRCMNIHPALLPAFPGLHVQQKAIDWGVKFSGATVHFVAEDVDMGPIIIQAVVPVLQDDTEDALAARILVEEHKIYPEAVRLFFEGRLEVRGRRVFIRDA